MDSETPSISCGLDLDAPCTNITKVFEFISGRPAETHFQLVFLDAIHLNQIFLDAYALNQPNSHFQLIASSHMNLTFTNLHIILAADTVFSSENIFLLDLAQDGHITFQSTTVHVYHTELSDDVRVLRINASRVSFVGGTNVEGFASFPSEVYERELPLHGKILSVVSSTTTVDGGLNMHNMGRYVGWSAEATDMELDSVFCTNSTSRYVCANIRDISGLLTIRYLECRNLNESVCLEVFRSTGSIHLHSLRAHNITGQHVHIAFFSPHIKDKMMQEVILSSIHATNNRIAQFLTINHALNAVIRDMVLENNVCIIPVYVITADKLTLTNSRLSHNSGIRGGILSAKVSAHVSNCTFTHTVTSHFGALVLSTPHGIVEDCIFEHNVAETGAAIQIAGAETRATVSRCIFRNNTAAIGGAICTVFFQTLKVTHCTFEENSAHDMGAAIYIEAIIHMMSNVYLSDSNFTKNTVGRTPMRHVGNLKRGGTVSCVGRVMFEILRLYFNENLSYFHAADILVELVMSSDTIDVQASHIRDVLIEKSKGTLTGGNIYYTGSVVLTNLEVRDIGKDGGPPPADVIYFEGSTGSMTNCHFHSVLIATSTVIMRSSVLEVHNSEFTVLSSMNRGSAFTLDSSTVQITNCNFSMSNSYLGGAIQSIGFSQVHIRGSHFSRLTSMMDGGALYIDHTAPMLKRTEYVILEDCTFSECDAQSNGGALYVSAGTVHVLGQTTMYWCQGEYGGSIYLDGKSRLRVGMTSDMVSLPGTFQSLESTNGNLLIIDTSWSEIGGGAIIVVGRATVDGPDASIITTNCRSGSFAPHILVYNSGPGIPSLDRRIFSENTTILSEPRVVRVLHMLVNSRIATQYVPGFELSFILELIDAYGVRISNYKPLALEASVDKMSGSFLYANPLASDGSFKNGLLYFKGLSLRVTEVVAEANIAISIEDKRLRIKQMINVPVGKCPPGFSSASGICVDCNHLCSGNGRCIDGRCQCLDGFSGDSCSTILDTKTIEKVPLNVTQSGVYDRISKYLLHCSQEGALMLVHPISFRQISVVTEGLINCVLSNQLPTGEIFLYQSEGTIHKWQNGELIFFGTVQLSGFIVSLSAVTISESQIKLIVTELLGSVSVFLVDRNCSTNCKFHEMAHVKKTEDWKSVDSPEFKYAHFGSPIGGMAVIQHPTQYQATAFVIAHSSLHRIQHLENMTMPVDSIFTTEMKIITYVCADQYDDTPFLVTAQGRVQRMDIDTFELTWIAGASTVRSQHHDDISDGSALSVELPILAGITCLPTGLLLFSSKGVSMLYYGKPCAVNAADVSVSLSETSIVAKIPPPSCTGGVPQYRYRLSARFLHLDGQIVSREYITPVSPFTIPLDGEKYSDLLQVQIHIWVGNRIGESSTAIKHINHLSCMNRPTQNEICTDHGTCQVGVCQCFRGWGGKYCETPISSSTKYFDDLFGEIEPHNRCDQRSKPCHNLQHLLMLTNGGDDVEYVGAKSELSLPSDASLFITADATFDFHDLTLVASSMLNVQVFQFLNSNVTMRNLNGRNLHLRNGFLDVNAATVTLENVHFDNIFSNEVLLSCSTSNLTLLQGSLNNIMSSKDIMHSSHCDLALRQVTFDNARSPTAYVLQSQGSQHTFVDVLLHNSSSINIEQNSHALFDNLTCIHGKKCLGLKGGIVHVTNLVAAHMVDIMTDEYAPLTPAMVNFWLCDKLDMTNVRIESNVLHDKALHMYSIPEITISGLHLHNNHLSNSQSHDGVVRVENAAFLSVKNLICTNHTVSTSPNIRGGCFSGHIMFLPTGSEWEFSDIWLESNTFFGPHVSYGGAMFLFTENRLSTVTLTNITCIGNSAAHGGCVVVESSHKVILRDSKFVGNSASRGGGALSVISVNSFELENLHFEDNTAMLSGSALALSGYASPGDEGFQLQSHLWNCTFLHNRVESLIIFDILSGGKESDGGALHIGITNTPIELSHCTFEANEAQGRGGDVFLEPLSHVPVFRDSVFRNSWSIISGGSMYVQGGLILENCTFASTEVKSSAQSSGGGGAIHAKAANILIVSCNFEYSIANVGGILFCEASACRVERSMMSDAVAFRSGGAIYALYGPLVVLNSQFVHCESIADGGCISMVSSSALRVEDTTFSHTIARSEGGVISIYETEVSKIVSVALPDEESAIALKNIEMRTTKSVYGGAIFARTSLPLKLDNVHISDSDCAAGTILLDQKSKLIAKDVTMENCIVTMHGHLIALSNTAILEEVTPILEIQTAKQVSNPFLVLEGKQLEHKLARNVSIVTSPVVISVDCLPSNGATSSTCRDGIAPNSEFSLVLKVMDAYSQPVRNMGVLDIEFLLEAKGDGAVVWRSTIQKVKFDTHDERELITGLKIDGKIGTPFYLVVVGDYNFKWGASMLYGSVDTKVAPCSAGLHPLQQPHPQFPHQTVETCIECPEGQYSLVPSDECHSCLTLEGAKSCKADKATVSSGYYAALDSSNTLRTYFCPKEQCNGAVVDSRSLVQNECKSHHDGFLCSSCVKGYTLFNGACVWCKAFSFDSLLVYLTSIVLLTMYYHFTSTSEKNSAGVAIFINFVQTLSICIKFRTWINRSERFSSFFQNISVVFQQVLMFFSVSGLSHGGDSDQRPWSPTMRCPYNHNGLLTPATMILQTVLPFVILLLAFVCVLHLNVGLQALRHLVQRMGGGQQSPAKDLHSAQSLVDMELPLLDEDEVDHNDIPEDTLEEPDSSTENVFALNDPWDRGGMIDGERVELSGRSTSGAFSSTVHGKRLIQSRYQLLRTKFVKKIRKVIRTVYSPQAYTLTLCSLIFYTYQPLASTTFMFFNCFQMDDNSPSVNIHFSSIQCSGWGYNLWLFFFYLPLLIYIILCPIVILASLFLLKQVGALQTRTFKNWFGSLYAKYREERYYFEIVPMVRRFFLVGSTILADKLTLLGAAHLENLFFSLVISANIIMLYIFKPYRLKSDNYMEIFAFSSIVVMKALEEGAVDSVARFVGMLVILAAAFGIALFLIAWIIARPVYSFFKTGSFKRIGSSASRLDEQTAASLIGKGTVSEDVPLDRDRDEWGDTER